MSSIEQLNATIKRLKNELQAARAERAELLVKQSPWAIGDLLQADNVIYKVGEIYAEHDADCVVALCWKMRPDGTWSRGNAHPVRSDHPGVTVIADSPQG